MISSEFWACAIQCETWPGYLAKLGGVDAAVFAGGVDAAITDAPKISS